MAPLKGKVALVTGCNGITGHAIVEHLIRQPEPEWTKIVVTSRKRPSPMTWCDHRVVFVPLDFLSSSGSELEALMKPYCSDVTHAFFASYAHHTDFAKLAALNIPLFTNFLTAIDSVARGTLQRVVLQTGGKHYGVHLGPMEMPVHEGIQRYQDRGENFYYGQEDALFALSSQRPWGWNVIRPHGIIGFTPGAAGMSMALTVAIYFLCCRELGETPAFPGNEFFYNSPSDASYAPSIADMAVWAGTGEHTKDEAFTHVNGDVIVYRSFWPQLGRYFGIDIPQETNFTAAGQSQRLENSFRISEWARDKREVWERVVSKHGGRAEAFDWATWEFLEWGLATSWYVVGTASKARKMGWARYEDTYDGWAKTFREYENFGTLPMRSPDVVERAEALERAKRSGLRPHPGEEAARRVEAERSGEGKIIPL